MPRCPEERSDHAVLRRLMLLLIAFAVVSVCAGVSRMCPLPGQSVACLDVLRVREVLSLFVFAPILSLLFWMLSRTVGRGHTSMMVDALMVLAIYGIACGMGIHDPLNQMQRAYPQLSDHAPAVWRSLRFLDDALSHWVFWSGFVLASWVIGVQQALHPLARPMAWPWRMKLGMVTVLLGWVMVENLRHEYPRTKADLVVIALALAFPLLVQMIVCRRVELLRQPMLYVMYPAYGGALMTTLLCWVL